MLPPKAQFDCFKVNPSSFELSLKHLFAEVPSKNTDSFILSIKIKKEIYEKKLHVKIQ